MTSSAPAGEGLDAARCLALAAAPVFAAMALFTALGPAGPMEALCTAGSPLGGMAPMYLLMSAFHAGPWLKLASRLRRPAAEAGAEAPAYRA